MFGGMIHADEIAELERRAHKVRVTMPELCRMAGKHPSSWYRARSRGRADYTLIAPLESAMDQLERERKSA